MTPTRRSARVAKKSAPTSTAIAAKKRGGAKTDLDAIPEVIMMDGDGPGEGQEMAESEAPRTANKQAGGCGGENAESDSIVNQQNDSTDEVRVEKVEIMPDTATDAKPTRGRKCKLSHSPFDFCSNSCFQVENGIYIHSLLYKILPFPQLL